LIFYNFFSFSYLSAYKTGILFSNTEDSVFSPSEKLHLPPLIKKSLASYGTQRFLKNVFTKACQWARTSATYATLMSWRSINLTV